MHKQPSIGVIIPAAGSSTRFGQKDKLAEDIGGRPLLIRTVEFFTKCEAVRDIVVAGPPEHFDDFKEKFAPTLSFHGVRIVEGDAQSRALSVLNALSAMSPDVTHIAVHDAARPAVNTELFERLILASRECLAVVPAIPLNDTVKRADASNVTVSDDDAIADSILGDDTKQTVDTHRVTETVDREGLFAIQTPQLFEADLLRRAYQQDSLDECTDDASVVEKLGEPVYLVEGDSRNIKVTRFQDLKLIKAIMGIREPSERSAHKRF
ncbi:MAG: hypothetical protein CMJ38_08980 [Phycisphaerae bacterium]|nr:hypothetical protein [Phycisphaerae bacterium]